MPNWTSSWKPPRPRVFPRRTAPWPFPPPLPSRRRQPFTLIAGDDLSSQATLVVAYLLVFGGVGAGNSALWRSWDLSAVIELGFGGKGDGAGIRRRARKWELLADTKVGFVRVLRAGVRWRARSRDSLAGAVMGFVGGLRSGYSWRARSE